MNEASKPLFTVWAEEDRYQDYQEYTNCFITNIQKKVYSLFIQTHPLLQVHAD